MLRTSHILGLLASCLLLGGACTTRGLDSAMIHYRPKDHMRKRPEKVLLQEVREVLEYDLSADDFIATHSVDGHTCWIILYHKESVPIVVDKIRRAKGYKYIAVGKFDSQYRSLLGFGNTKENEGDAAKK